MIERQAAPLVGHGGGEDLLRDGSIDTWNGQTGVGGGRTNLFHLGEPWRRGIGFQGEGRLRISTLCQDIRASSRRTSAPYGGPGETYISP